MPTFKGSTRDSTWVQTGKIKKQGYHKCCESKTSDYHKSGCKYVEQLTSDDYSDLKDNNETN